MRISDWSSDVCSSDLAYDRDLVDLRMPPLAEELHLRLAEAARRRQILRRREGLVADAEHEAVVEGRVQFRDHAVLRRSGEVEPDDLQPHHVAERAQRQCHAFSVLMKIGDTTGRLVLRSEEHTSELQSLMRISYAVFCLKKKNNDQQPQT